jgi:hypothetical protein
MKTTSEGIYGRLLRFLPASLRNGFEDEMTHDFLMRLQETRGIAGKALVWLRGLTDILCQGVSELLYRWVG